MIFTSNQSWKGQNFTQIISSIQLNKNSSILTPYNLTLPPPLKIYRKEILPVTNSSRLGITIRSLETPNGYIISKQDGKDYLSTILDKQEAGVTNNDKCCNETQNNALKRIRTSGIIDKSYSIDSKQYMTKRCKTIKQNEFKYLVSGDASVKPGSSGSLSNEYSPQISECDSKQVTYKPNNSGFACDGAVSSSSLILRKKYLTITSNASKYLIPYGPAVSNEMQYGISDSIYTYKDKFAFPTKLTPVSKKMSQTVQCVNLRNR